MAYLRKIGPPRLAALTTLLVVLVGAGVQTETARAAFPADCAGVGQGLYQLEAQGWWEASFFGLPPGIEDQGHVHIGGAMPYCQRVTGKRMYTLTAKMHDNPGKIIDLKAKVYSGSGGTQTNIGVTYVSWSCPPNAVTGIRDCSFTGSLTADFSLVPNSGWAMFRIRAEGRASTGADRSSIMWVPVYVDNGKPRSDYTKLDVRGTGWYEDAGYMNVRFGSPYPVKPVSGTWTFNVKFDSTVENCSNGTKCADEPTHVFGAIDPNFHADPVHRGTVVLDGPAPNGPVTKTISVDTTKLTNGTHKLFLRGDGTDDAPFSRPAQNAGGLVIPFTVQN